MNILVLKESPLEYQIFPLYREDGITPLGQLVEVDEKLLNSNQPLKFDGENVVVDINAQNALILARQKSEIERKIAENKLYLTDTDYLLFKVMDGALSSENYESVKLKRAEARTKINDLEKELI